MLRVAFALWFGWVIAGNLRAQPMEEAAAPLAVRISSLLPRRATVSLELQDLTAIAPASSSSFRNALEQELSKVGLRMAATQPDTRLHITLSENARGPLFVVEMVSGENRQVMMLPWTAPSRPESKPRLKITSRPVWEQGEPILDILLLNSDADLLVLNPAKLSSYRLLDGKWAAAGTAILPLATPPVRDPRGRIEMTSGALHVYVPGATCTGTLQPALRLSCAAANETWPLHPSDPNTSVRWVNDRNLLESNLLPAAFYSGAFGWFAAVDSRVVNRAGDSLAGSDSWGSDLAGINNSCGANPTVLASARGDNADRDQVTAYEIAGDRAAAASEPLALPGPVTTLWPAENSGQVTLVIRNSKTGDYEASRLGLACAQ